MRILLQEGSEWREVDVVPKRFAAALVQATRLRHPAQTVRGEAIRSPDHRIAFRKDSLVGVLEKALAVLEPPST